MIAITTTRVDNAILRESRTTESPGFCLSCGDERPDVETDGQAYKCWSCGEEAVYGLFYISCFLIQSGGKPLGS